jgi:quercetin dioxygenase-like cupin family protein
MATKALFVEDEGGRRVRALGSTMVVKAAAAQTGGAYEVVVVECGPGGDGVPHRHPWQELYLVLEGEMTVTVGARTHRAGPGDLVTIPPKALHTFTVTSERARFAHISIGPGATAMFDDFAEAVPEEPTLDDLPTIFEINRRHGVELQLPDELVAELAGDA